MQGGHASTQPIVDADGAYLFALQFTLLIEKNDWGAELFEARQLRCTELGVGNDNPVDPPLIEELNHLQLARGVMMRGAQKQGFVGGTEHLLDAFDHLAPKRIGYIWYD
jgi:hypothetical protein